MPYRVSPGSYHVSVNEVLGRELLRFKDNWERDQPPLRLDEMDLQLVIPAEALEISLDFEGNDFGSRSAEAYIRQAIKNARLTESREITFDLQCREALCLEEDFFDQQRQDELRTKSLDPILRSFLSQILAKPLPEGWEVKRGIQFVHNNRVIFSSPVSEGRSFQLHAYPFLGNLCIALRTSEDGFKQILDHQEHKDLSQAASQAAWMMLGAELLRTRYLESVEGDVSWYQSEGTSPKP